MSVLSPSAQAGHAFFELGASLIAERNPTSPLASGPVLNAVVFGTIGCIAVVVGMAAALLDCIQKNQPVNGARGGQLP